MRTAKSHWSSSSLRHGRSNAHAAKRQSRKRKASIVTALRDELRLSGRPLGFLAETAAMPIVLLSTDFTVLGLNREAERVLGRPQEEFIGKDYFRITRSDGRGGLTRGDLKQALAGQPARGIEGWLRQPDGTEHVLLWNAMRLADSDGVPLGVLAVAQDITDRQRTEEALREREARLSSIIATAPDAVITIDESGVIQSFSSAAEKLFGYAAGEVIGNNVTVLMPSLHRQNDGGYLARYLRTGIKRTIGFGWKVEGRRKDGAVFPVELSVGEISLGSKRIFTGFIRDISSREKMENELRHAQKMEAVGQLTGGLAHDFNNLLTVIIGNLELLERRLKQAADRDIVIEAQTAADRGAQLASRLLAFGRRQSLIPKPIDLNALVQGLTDLLRRSLAASIRIETRLGRDLSIAMADPGQVENALLNLALNARDAMPSGGRLLIETGEAEIDDTYTAEHDDVAPGSYVSLAVSDTGMGMSAEVRQRAFEPFFTTKERGAGSGLGLSMVYGFVKQSGGHVQLYSEPGLGTTVRIYLPVLAKKMEPENADEDARAEVMGEGERILVVEDDDQVRNISVRRLKEIGYAVTEAQNGPEALAVLQSGETVDLLFTDIVMPGGMNGIDLARAARRQRPELKILFTSGYSGQAALEDAVLTSNADWLAKPYKTHQLASKLRELLSH